MKTEIKNLGERVKKLSGAGDYWPSLTENERRLAEAIPDSTGIPEAQLTPYPEAEWVKQHWLRQEAEHDKLLESKTLEDITKAVEVIREWFPGEFTERGERSAVALLFEAMDLHDDEDFHNPHVWDSIGGWVFSLVPGIHKTRKGLIHQYKRAMAAGSISK